MTKRGMGFCYTNGSKRQRIKENNSTYKKEILWRYYAPYHIAVLDEVNESLKLFNTALLIDCHSFSSVPLPYELEQDKNRPDICIGTDEYHTSKELANCAKDFFKMIGYSVCLNKPYSGGFVPLQKYHIEPRVSSIMIEVNRKLYMNETTLEKSENFKTIQQELLELEKILLRVFVAC